ncbi:sensor histidine kinase [Paenibacillus sp. LHD-117]|uniref:cache domain-containing sensor histidine kinase n=1 Tax=Paenibacillus sp. LHD-117 TaxID=3071412 RepID=UPI0027E09DEE|nr:sensor histidine kinase [Paenibacillus sp. LHD-117]MDQ6422908.1 sensor histidine kinase [Paenibacillus sp. LHD-117]
MKPFQSIHGRLFPMFLLSMLGLLLVVTVVFYHRATEQVRDKVSSISEKNISQTVDLFDLLLKSYDSVTKSLNSNNELIRLLKQYSTADSVQAVQLEKQISDIIAAIFYSRSDNVGIHIVTRYDKVFSFDRTNGGSVREYSETSWFTELKGSTGEMKWLGVYPESLMSAGIHRPVFAFGRQLFELSSLKSIGIVLIETDADAIASALTNASLSADSQVVIRDADGADIIRSKVAEETQIGDIPAGWPGKIAPGAIVARSVPGAMMTAARIGIADWTMISITPNKELQLELKDTQQFLISLSLILIVAATVLATLVSRSFSSPFKRLIQQMKMVELGNFKGEVQVQSYYEINVLVGSFNRMVQQMDDLIERIKLSSISEKNAQLQALQSQVNPHFLFNTLDMIYWMLDERENDRLGRVILALSRIFRYSSDWEEASMAKLRLELEQFRHYFTIIETRLGGRVQTSIEVEERWLGVEVPKMILQPIVENAVKYGLEPLKRPGSLHVYSREADGGKLEIVVEDDGIGMDEDTLRRIRTMLEEAPQAPVQEEAGSAEGEGGHRARRGIGLLNVHRRIRLMFGEAYGLRVESEMGEGTVIIASFPIQGGEGTSG